MGGGGVGGGGAAAAPPPPPDGDGGGGGDMSPPPPPPPPLEDAFEDLFEDIEEGGTGGAVVVTEGDTSGSGGSAGFYDYDAAEDGQDYTGGDYTDEDDTGADAEIVPEGDPGGESGTPAPETAAAPPPVAAPCVDNDSCNLAAEYFRGADTGQLEEFCTSTGKANCPILCGDPRCGGDGEGAVPSDVFDEVLVVDDDGFVTPSPAPENDTGGFTDPLVSAQPPPQDLAAQPTQFVGAVTLSFGYCHLGAPAVGFNLICSKISDAAMFRSSRLEVADCSSSTFEAVLVFPEPDLRPVDAPSEDPAAAAYACTARAEGDLGVSQPSNTVYLARARSAWPPAPKRPECPSALGITPPPPQLVRPVSAPASDAVAVQWAYCGIQAGIWADYFDVSCDALNTAGVFLDEEAREGLLTGGALLPVAKKEVREATQGCFQRVGQAVVNGLIPGVTYECRVAAVGPLGPSEFSEPAFPTAGWGSATADAWTNEQAELFCSTQYRSQRAFSGGQG